MTHRFRNGTISFLAVLLLVPFAVRAGGQDDDKRVLRIIAFGAHPDDAEFQIGGTAAKWIAM